MLHLITKKVHIHSKCNSDVARPINNRTFQLKQTLLETLS